tara:strand:- start:100506 stop:102245 length:1740 start_codon:yes stop_codon:yes gene_type:complete
VIDRHPYLLVFLVAVAAHTGALGAIFYLDDDKLLLPIDSGTSRQLQWNPSGFRWITYFTFWLNHKVAGLSSVAFHAGNIAIHAAVSVLVFFVARDWLTRDQRTDEPKAMTGTIALAAACLFAAHPLGSELTHYVRARDTSLMTFFGIASAWVLSRYRGQDSRRLVIAACLGLAAMYSKPTGPPWVIGLALWTMICFWRKPQWSGLLKNRLHWLLVSGALIIALATVGADFLYALGQSVSVTKSFVFSPALHQTWLTQTRHSSLIAKQLVAPTDLTSDHQGYYSFQWSDPAVLGGTAGLLACVILATVCWRRGHRWQAWAVGALVGSHMIHGIYVTGEIYCEYRTYPSLICFCLLFAWVTASMWRRTSLSVAWYHGLFVILVLAGGVGTWCRSSTWRSVETLSADVLKTYPLHIRAHHHSIMAASIDGTDELVIDRFARMNRAMGDIQDFNRASPHGRLYNWDLAVKHAVIATSIAARSTARLHGLEAGMQQLDQLDQKLRQQPIRLEGYFANTQTIGRAWVLYEGGALDELGRLLESKRPFKPAWFSREVRTIIAKAKETGHTFPWENAEPPVIDLQEE